MRESLRRPRLVALLAALVAILVVALVPAAGSADTATPADTATTSPDPVKDPVTGSARVISYNAAAGTTVAETKSDIKALIGNGADIIALQEMSSWKKYLMVQKNFVDCDGCKWAWWRPVMAVPGGQPIMYRTDKYDLLQRGKKQLTEDTYVGPRGAGPKVMRARWVTWVELRDRRTYRQIWVVNNHAVPTVQRSDGTPNWTLKKRVELYKKHMLGLRAFLDHVKQVSGGEILVTGDFNVNFRTDHVVRPKVFPYYNLHVVANGNTTFGALGMPSRGTHVLPNGSDKRIIDYGYFWPRKFVKPAGERILLGLNSDHRPLRVDYRIYGRGCFSGRKNIC